MTSPGESQPPKKWWLENACQVAVYRLHQAPSMSANTIPSGSRSGTVWKGATCLLRHDTGFDTMQARIIGVAAMLEEKSAIPMVAAQLTLLHAIQTDEFWTDIQLVQLEEVRLKLRPLIKLIERV